MNIWGGKCLISFISLWSYAISQSKLSCYVGNNPWYPYLKITDPVFDNKNFTTVPYNRNTLPFVRVSEVEYSDKHHSLSLILMNMKDNGNYLRLNVSQMDETMVSSRETDEFLYKFDLILHCHNGDTVTMHTVVPIVDTNNHQPFFKKKTYTYNLISSYPEDFKRQQYLNPIIANDYDITNHEVEFKIQDNEYFNVVYNGIVPKTLNKQHYALLEPKIPGARITKKTEVVLTVTDVGYPPQETSTKIIINPPSPPIPRFDKTFYVGHFYKNRTFVTGERPKLLEGVTFYQTDVYIRGSDDFQAFLNNEEIVVKKNLMNMMDETMFYKRNYVACELTATYTDRVTKLYSSNSATFIVELHHDI